MDKNWLIRTKSNHILGPVSKEKVLELYHNGSIKPDDEVCSGNGYWFFVREDDLVARFLVGNEIQSFNPISEAKDVLRTSGNMGPGVPEEDITLVGGINLATLKEEPKTEPRGSEVQPLPAEETSASTVLRELVPAEVKKKNNLEIKPRTITPKKKVLKKQGWLKYVGLIAFLILLILIYYRSSVINYLFKGEISSLTPSIIGSAHAQSIIPEKKKSPISDHVVFDKITFKPRIGFDGFQVISSFNIEEVTCANLESEVYQLAVILHPPEVINEKFLLRLRDCVLGLPDIHPLKRWMKWIGTPRQLTSPEQERAVFLAEVINSPFNLITDVQMRNRIISFMPEIPESGLSERLLKAYLYLMIGNITRSDNILRSIVKTSPRDNWAQVSKGPYQRIGKENAEQIFKKLANHPADRKSFELLSLYLLNFYNDEGVLELAGGVATNSVLKNLGLEYVKSLAPDFIEYLQLKNLSDIQRIALLRQRKNISPEWHVYWIWPFFNVDALISESMTSGLELVEEEDQLWFIYLMDDERLFDFYSRKKSRNSLLIRRPYLKAKLKDQSSFMMSLFKLIEFGDIDTQLVEETVSQLIDV